MKKGVKFMKILKYEDNVSYLFVDGKYKKLLEISKEDILKSLEYIYENEDIELEEYDKEKIVNEAEKIVYENLFNKLNKFKEDKPILKNEIDGLFKDLEEKYKIS
jgi:DNA polymerase III gamma/tau subunit